MRTLGISQYFVATVCQEYGVVLRPAVLSKWTEAMKDEAVRLYQSGLSARQVAMKMGRGYRQTKQYLDERGVKSRGRGLRGEQNYFWKSGQVVDEDGYILVYAPDHPYRTASNKVRQHRLVMEKKLGRYLKPTEVVDHINGVTNDNRPENLRVFSSNAEHLHVTLKGRVPKWTEDGLRRMRAAHPKSRTDRPPTRGVGR